MIWLSVALVVVEPISACMLLVMVLRHRQRLGIHWLMRLWLSVLASGLIMHAMGHVELLFNYRPPRTLAWLPIFAAINGLIWTAFLTDWMRRRAIG